MFRYFKNGLCRGGNNCRYRHVQTARHDSSSNETEISSTPTSNSTCRFFKYGTCKFGSQCHFLHNSETIDNACTQTNLRESSSLRQRTTTTSTSVELKNTYVAYTILCHNYI